MIDYYKNYLKGDGEFSSVVADFEKRAKQREELRNNDVLFKDWVVKLNGDMVNIKYHDYLIDADTISQSDWISHIKSKNWDMNTFLDAYFFALTFRFNINKLNIDIR